MLTPEFSYNDEREGGVLMNSKGRVFCLEVGGDFACFTRPEMKVERVSYDVITPSAARNIFQAIFWKPAIQYRICKIEVLNPIRWASVRRNEVGAVASERSEGIFIEDARQQRAGLFLRDVAYRLHAWIDYTPVGQRPLAHRAVPDGLWDQVEAADLGEAREAWQARKDENPGKYMAMFERRAQKGQCFNQPYLGTREFSCSFKLIEDPKAEADHKPPIQETKDLGFMLYDLDFTNPADPKPAFYRPKMQAGVIEVPRWESEEVRK
jgi:CRISPR-associated protein Cas5d